MTDERNFEAPVADGSQAAALLRLQQQYADLEKRLVVQEQLAEAVTQGYVELRAELRRILAQPRGTHP